MATGHPGYGGGRRITGSWFACRHGAGWHPPAARGLPWGRDEERAVAAIPRMLPADKAVRLAAFDVVRRIVAAGVDGSPRSPCTANASPPELAMAATVSAAPSRDV